MGLVIIDAVVAHWEAGSDQGEPSEKGNAVRIVDMFLIWDHDSFNYMPVSRVIVVPLFDCPKHVYLWLVAIALWMIVSTLGTFRKRFNYWAECGNIISAALPPVQVTILRHCVHQESWHQTRSALLRSHSVACMLALWITFTGPELEQSLWASVAKSIIPKNVN